MTLKGSYNTYLGQGCRLLLVNSSEATVSSTVTMRAQDGSSVLTGAALDTPAHGLTDFDLCAASVSGAYGTVVVQPATANTTYANVLRIGSAESYRFSTAVRQ